MHRNQHHQRVSEAYHGSDPCSSNIYIVSNLRCARGHDYQRPSLGASSSYDQQQPHFQPTMTQSNAHKVWKEAKTKQFTTLYRQGRKGVSGGI